VPSASYPAIFCKNATKGGKSHAGQFLDGTIAKLSINIAMQGNGLMIFL
jgi:hypothetical protein